MKLATNNRGWRDGGVDAAAEHGGDYLRQMILNIEGASGLPDLLAQDMQMLREEGLL